MNTVVSLLHVLFAGLWLGCVLTEALFERALFSKDREQALKLARLHVRVDQFVELPAMLGVLITGAVRIEAPALTPWLIAMIVCGVVALMANAFCIGIVFRRAAAADAGEMERFERLDHLQHKIGTVVLLGLLGALATGLAAHL